MLTVGAPTGRSLLQVNVCKLLGSCMYRYTPEICRAQVGAPSGSAQHITQGRRHCLYDDICVEGTVLRIIH